MQELSTQSAGILIAANFNPMETYDTSDPFFNEYALGVLVKIKQSRYRGFARPGDVLDVEVNIEEQIGDVFDFSCTIRSADTTIMRNKFQLANINRCRFVLRPRKSKSTSSPSRAKVPIR